jgi:predicted O-linked N-acetylglucosamine transferase (SPINDLY family)
MPTIPETLNLALQHHQAGRLQEAEVLYRRILQTHPDHSDALHGLGLIAHQVGRHEAAVDLIGKAIAINSAVPEYHNNIGEAYRAQGKRVEAGNCYRLAVALKPDYAEAYNNQGLVLQEQGKLEEAVAHYRQALALKPAYAGASYNLGNALREAGKLGEAADQYRQALALSPEFAEACNNLGNVLKDQGLFEEAVGCYRQALAVRPGFVAAHSNLILTMTYSTAYSAGALAAELRYWNDLHARPLAPPIRSHKNDADGERRLRVGYVSADFRGHALSHFTRPLLAAHDRAGVEVFCYSNAPFVDETTAQFQRLADGWRNIATLTDEAVAECIRADGIDILVDLSGHTGDNRLLVFARKPAPVQAAYFGTVVTTGLTAIDYRFTDRYLSPPDSPEWSSETLIRLPACVACYQPPAWAPDVAPLPAFTNPHVTFGCFNNLAKVGPEVIALWSHILRALPTARLILKDRTLVDTTQRAKYVGLFRDCGVSPERLDLLPRTPVVDYLAAYGRVDIALDPFPFNGCTTTCEALWMGVPVVTLAGDASCGRFGVSLLSTVGLPRFIATKPEAYVKVAVDLAADLGELAALRAGLRPLMAASPLCDPKALAKAVEDAYRLMWRRWCQGDDGRARRAVPLRIPHDHADHS